MSVHTPGSVQPGERERVLVSPLAAMPRLRCISRIASTAVLVGTTACAGASMTRGTGEADTIEEASGSEDEGDDGNAADDAAEDPTAADDGASAGDESEGPASDDDAGSTDDAGDDDPTDATEDGADAATSDETTGDPGTTDDGATTEEPTTDDGGNADTVDLSGFILLQTDSARELVLPEGTIVPVGGAIVIGRDASRAAFEDFWGVAMGDDVVYVDGIDNFPNINGAETYTLLTPLRTVVDGPSPGLVALTSSARTDASAEASDPEAWSSSASPNLDATPGTSIATGGQTGSAFLGEVVDATGAGNYLYEFVEIGIAP